MSLSSQGLSHRQVCVLFVLKGLYQREGKTLLQGKFQEPLAPIPYSFTQPDNEQPEADKETFLKIWNQEIPFLKDADPIELLSQTRLKGLRQNAQLALLAYFKNQWPLLGRWDYPTPEELLAIQARGQRVVSVLNEKSFDEMITADKNNLEFTIHDLEHAAKYFENPNQFAAQKNQFQLFLKLSEEKTIQTLYQEDPLYLKDWHYLISDMNTAPAHSWFFFRGTLLNAFKRRAGVSLTEKLPPNFENDFASFEKTCLENYFQIDPQLDRKT